MLDLNSILWVVPGVVFIYVYNKKRPSNSIGLSGWPYVFSLVIIATLIWLPVELFLNKELPPYFREWQTLIIPIVTGLIACLTALFFTVDRDKIFSRYYFLLPIIMAILLWWPILTLFKNKMDYYGIYKKSVLTLFTAILISFALSWILKKFLITSSNLQDDFIKHCIEWENQLIILSLQNDKVYIGVLMKYPESSLSSYDSQMISIIPVISGGRRKETKKVKWEDRYPTTRSELLIPRNSITSFGKFNREIFDSFQEHFTRKKILQSEKLESTHAKNIRQ